MSEITNDGLTRSGTGCFIAVGLLGGNSGHQRVKTARCVCHKGFLAATNRNSLFCWAQEWLRTLFLQLLIIQHCEHLDKLFELFKYKVPSYMYT